METEGVNVEVQPIHAAKVEANGSTFGENRTLYAIVAYHYPQYTLKDVEDMPYRDVALLLRTAEQIEAGRMFNYTMIASAPQSKNGKGVKTLMEHFRKIIKG